ncbi:glycosyltransferase [Echinicola salinicaeni]|uniref:glycosyltransferase n=1 Tax=Echinicola salinicaeni TaxID=2762757 RepID=UPI0016466C56|nr:glycosyltransferase [Echinicola salinicaeni]
MKQQVNPSKKITEVKEFPYQYSVCTLVTDHTEYNEMKASCLKAGFGEDVCEYLIIDNSNGNSIDAYKGLNLFLQKAQGKYIIICHQDIYFHDDRREILEQKIAELDLQDPMWGVIGNAGRVNMKYFARNLKQGTEGIDFTEKDSPIQVMSVDENFMLVKNEANLSLSADLQGFHMYGPDLCLIAHILGYHVYVIDFNLIHKSDGNLNNTFMKAKNDFIVKYSNALRPRFMASTAARFYIGSNPWKKVLFNTNIVLFFIRQYDKFFKGKRIRLN